MLFPVDEFRPVIPHRRLAFLPMPRMKIQLTSARDDGDWTWRAEGARQPKGSIDRNLVPDGAVVGDVLRVEVDQFMDGIEVTSVLQGQADRSGAETLEIIGSGRNEPLVTSKLAGGRGRRGVPGLRTAIEAQNKAAEAADQPGIPADLLLKLAEQIHPALRSADWQDRAEAALAGVGDVDLRDLRSVVVAADSAFRTDENRALADQLREALTARLEREQQAWQAEVTSAMDEDRIVRALRLSSRPPKAGAPLPGPVLDRLATMAEASLTSETGQDRWATLLDAVALSPVHLRVVPAGLPAEPGDQLLDVVKRVSMGVPAIAAAFGIEPTAPPRSRRGRPRG